MEEKYGIRRFPYPAYGAQLAMAQVDPNSGRLIIPNQSRLCGSAPAFVPGQLSHTTHGSRAQSPASLLLQQMSRRQQDEPLNGNGSPGNYYQLSQQSLRTRPVVGVSVTPEPQTLNTQGRSAPGNYTGPHLLEQDHAKRKEPSNESTTSVPEARGPHESQVQDIETDLLQAFAESNDAAAPQQAANEMLASKALAARPWPMARPDIQMGQNQVQQSTSSEAEGTINFNGEGFGAAMQQSFFGVSLNTGMGRLVALNDDDADDEINLDPALRRAQHLQESPSYGPASQTNSVDMQHSTSMLSGPGANLGQPQANAGGNQPKMKPGLTINTHIHLNKAQKMELAKEKTAHRPTQPLPTDHFTMDQYIGRPPSVLRERIAKPQQDTRNWFSEFTADELLHHMHPDDMCGTVIIEIAKQYSGAEIAGFANESYKLRGGAKVDVSTNAFTKRITLAVKHLCQDVKADRERVVDALADDRSHYRETGTSGSKAETVMQGIRDGQTAQVSSATVSAAAVQVLQPSNQIAASAPTTLPSSAASPDQSFNDSSHGPAAMRSAGGHSKRKRSDETGEVQQPKRAKHNEPDLEAEVSDEDAEFEFE